MQASFWVHGFPSLHTVPEGAGGPDWQTGVKPLQVSFCVQAFPSLQTVPAGAREAGWQTPDPLQASVRVQGFESLQGVPAEALPEPGRQTPVALQVSPTAQGFPSSHVVPPETGTWRHPCATLHESVVQPFPSLQFAATPAWHTPDPLQVSLTVQAFRSLQAVPAGAGPAL